MNENDPRPTDQTDTTGYDYPAPIGYNYPGPSDPDSQYSEYSDPKEYTDRAKNLQPRQMAQTDHSSTQYNYPGPYPHQQGYQPVPNQFAPSAPVNPEKNGMGLAAVILGPIGILFAVIPLTGFIAVIIGVVGLALGLAGWSRVRKNKATNGKTAIIGSILSLIALVVGIIGIIIVFQATAELGDDLECIANADSSSQIEACN